MLRSLFVLVSALALWVAPASAASFGFGCITGNAKQCTTGANQLSVEVTSSGGGVAFVLSNTGSGKLTATNLYLDDNAGVLGDIAGLLGAGSVDFGKGGKPGNLPGGKKAGFVADLVASAGKPAPKNGVKPGDSVVVHVALLGDNTLEDVLDALASGDLRIGVKASKSFINVPSGVVVPEPSSLALLALGALGLTVVRRAR